MDSRGLACLFGATLLAGACTTDVKGNDIFDPTGDGSSSTTSMTSNGPTTDASSSSTTGEATTDASSSSTGAAESSSSGGFGSLCGNGTIEGTEECDCGDDGECSVAELGDNGCENVKDPLVPGVLTGGVLGCNPASCRYDTSQCVYCGDGEINGNEVCELDLPIETSCQELGKGTAGKLVCMDSCQVDTTACTECGYQFDFEGTCDLTEEEGGWVTLRTTGAASVQTWACGNPGAFAMGPGVGKTGVWGTNLDGNYAADESGFVRSGLMDLSNCGDQTVTMTIRHWFQFEGGLGNNDGGIVQVTTGDPNQLKTGWVTLEPTGGVTYLPNVNASFSPVDGNPGFSGNDDDNEGMWVESTFDVTPYVGPQLYVRFVIGSDSGNERAGWYIDDVEILGSGG